MQELSLLKQAHLTMGKMIIYTSVIVVCILLARVFGKYTPDWDSLDSRSLPGWYDEAKIGIFMHWGVYSVPSFRAVWFWYRWKTVKEPDIVEFMQKNYPPDFTYADFASQFHAEFFDPNAWADLLKASGAKYYVVTSKHHEGFTNWPSNVSFNWNSMDVGPKRDLVGELAKAIRRRTDLRFGLYYSLFEWFNPRYVRDKANNYSTDSFVKEKVLPELMDIVNTYKPEVVFSDGQWEAPDTYWKSKEFLAWLYNHSPVKDTVVVNDRWGKHTLCKHGGYFTCGDKYNPGVLQKHKWENAMPVSSWGYRRDAPLVHYRSIEAILQAMAETISCGGNLLLDVGPTADGRIMPIFEERLRQMGAWLGINGEAIYASVPWTYQNDTITPRVWYTSKKIASAQVVFAILLDWPRGDILTLGAPVTTGETSVTLLGYKGQSFTFRSHGTGGGVNIRIPAIPFNNMPCQWVWVLKLTNLRNM